jgi:prepilin-type N-terminal cleavage/methylation domain-containing protein
MRAGQLAKAFTLIELLVVISIMGLLAALAVPAIKNLGKSNIQASAARQLLDDIGRARQLAISDHTTVYMVFVPTNFFNLVDSGGGNLLTDLGNVGTFSQASYQSQAMMNMSNLVPMQLGGYNFVSYGRVGDQPGQHVWHYLSTWQALPTGTFIAAQKFVVPTNAIPTFQIPAWQTDYASQIDNWLNLGPSQPQIYGFAASPYLPFPTEQVPSQYYVKLPCLTFDSTGRLISETPDNVSFHHAYIPLAQGTVGYGVDTKKQPTFTTVPPKAITENPPGNSSSISYQVIDVDPLTGRARMLGHQIQ